MKINDYCKYAFEGIPIKQTSNEIEEKPVAFFHIYNDEKKAYYINFNGIERGFIDVVYPFNYSRNFANEELHNKDIIISKIPPYNHAIFDNCFPYSTVIESNFKPQIVVTKDIYVIRLDKNKIDPYYINYILDTDNVKKFFIESAKQQKCSLLDLSDILEVDIPEFNDEMKNRTIEHQKNLMKEANDFRISVYSVGGREGRDYIKEQKEIYNSIIDKFTSRQKKFIDIFSSKKSNGEAYSTNEISEIMSFSKEEKDDFLLTCRKVLFDSYISIAGKGMTEIENNLRKEIMKYFFSAPRKGISEEESKFLNQIYEYFVSTGIIKEVSIEEILNKNDGTKK